MIGTISGARATVSMLILPVAMTWLIAAGITAIRRAGVLHEEGANREATERPTAR